MYVAMFLTALLVYHSENIHIDDVLLSLYIRRKVHYHEEMNIMIFSFTKLFPLTNGKSVWNQILEIWHYSNSKTNEQRMQESQK